MGDIWWLVGWRFSSPDLSVCTRLIPRWHYITHARLVLSSGWSTYLVRYPLTLPPNPSCLIRMEYLVWYRQVLDLPVINSTKVKRVGNCHI